MSTRTPSTRNPASGTGKPGKTTRASRKRSAARPAKAAAKAAAATVSKASSAPMASDSGDRAQDRSVTMESKVASGAAPTIAATKTPDPVVVSEVKPVVTGTSLRKKALIEAVTERSGVKRRDAKAALEAALELLGEAIAEGKSINLPGFGKLKVTRTKQLANGQIFVARIRQPNASDEPGDETENDGDGQTEMPGKQRATDPLAEAGE